MLVAVFLAVGQIFWGVIGAYSFVLHAQGATATGAAGGDEANAEREERRLRERDRRGGGFCCMLLAIA